MMLALGEHGSVRDHMEFRFISCVMGVEGTSSRGTQQSEAEEQRDRPSLPLPPPPASSCPPMVLGLQVGVADERAAGTGWPQESREPGPAALHMPWSPHRDLSLLPGLLSSPAAPRRAASWAGVFGNSCPARKAELYICGTGRRP